MKNLLSLILFVIIFSGCKKDKDEDNPTTSYCETWKLVEVLEDPGDGSGVFESVDSEKTITIDCDNNKVSSNGDLCSLSTTSDNATEGEFSSADDKITPNDCSDRAISISISDDHLILTYTCFEACRAKYKKQ